MSIDRPGITFQNLVALLERTFSSKEATVESPKFVRDQDTGQRREFDILISVKSGAHLMTTAIECKDQKRPVGVPQIESFANKCERNHVGHRVVVSSSGFHPTARIKAQALAISCMEVREAEHFDWLAISAFWEHRRRFDPIEVKCGFGPGDFPVGKFKLFDESLGELSLQHFLNAIQSALPPDDDPQTDAGPLQRQVAFSNRMHAIDETEVRRAVLEATALVTYWIETKPVPFQLHSYVGDGVDYAIASADLEVGGVKGKIVMARGENQSVSVSWTKVQ